MTQATESARVIVAIDFGTSRSGFAYAFTADRKIVAPSAWTGQAIGYPKTANELVYGPDRRVVAWGHPAAQILAELQRRQQAQGYHLFRELRGELRSSDVKTRRGPALERPGGRFAVVDLVGDALRLLKELAWKRIEESTAGQVSEDEVIWCLTAPAGWIYKHEQLVRRAALNAGLLSSRRAADAGRFLLVPEPKAAAVYCQEKDHHTLTPGTRFIVVDAGATVSVTSHQVMEDGDLRGVAHGRGTAPGSIRIDQAFLDRFLAQKLTAEVLEAYRREEPRDFVEMMADWERIKCSFDPKASLGARRLPFRPPLFRLLQRFPAVREKLTAQGHEDGIYVEPRDLRTVFAPVLDEIVEKTRTRLEMVGSRRCDFLYLVGGLAASPLLRRRIRREFGSWVGKIVAPPAPGAAVMEGAVSFGLEPSVVRTRRSRLSYGCGSETAFDPERDPENRKLWVHDLGEWYCGNRFTAFVKAGDEIVVGRRVTRVFSPMTRAQQEIYVDFYASGKRDVRYLDEDGVEKVGEFSVKMPDSLEVNREVEVSMVFRENTIKVEAIDRSSGKKTRTSLRLAPTFSPERLGGDS
ncbi:MAG: chaperone protein [bacterium]|nr:chaperone protein [bacterium]